MNKQAHQFQAFNNKLKQNQQQKSHSKGSYPEQQPNNQVQRGLTNMHMPSNNFVGSSSVKN